MLAALATPVVFWLSVTVVEVSETIWLLAAIPVPETMAPTDRPVVLAKFRTALPLAVVLLVATERALPVGCICRVPPATVTEPVKDSPVVVPPATPMLPK